MADSQRTHISAFPLGQMEPSRVVYALQRGGFNAEWVSNRAVGDAWLLEMASETLIEDAVPPQARAEQIGLLIWRSLGRYVRVSVDIAPVEADSGFGCELGEASYLRLTAQERGQQKSPLF